MTTLITDKVTVAALHTIGPNQSITFKLPDGRALHNAKALACQQGRVEGCMYSVRTNHDKNEIKITRLDRPAKN